MHTIDIQTTQNVTIEYELAGLKDRFIAMLIDSLIILAAYFVLAMTLSYTLGRTLSDSPMSFYVVFGLFPIIGFLLYHLFSEIVANGQSWGKKAMGLKVVRLDGEEIGLSDFLLRAVFHIVDTFFSMGILAALLISSSQRKQRLGDMTANTTVIKLKSMNRFRLDDILNINSIDNYTPIYLDVKHFKEEDMLLVKSILSRYKSHPNLAHKEALVAAVSRFSALLNLTEAPKDKIQFLETLLKDYVVLTR